MSEQLDDATLVRVAVQRAVESMEQAEAASYGITQGPAIRDTLLRLKCLRDALTQKGAYTLKENPLERFGAWCLQGVRDEIAEEQQQDGVWFCNHAMRARALELGLISEQEVNRESRGDCGGPAGVPVGGAQPDDA